MKGGTCQFVESTGAEITRPVRETRRGGIQRKKRYKLLYYVKSIILHNTMGKFKKNIL